MKKLVSILLVVVSCYHWVGFWLTFKYRQYQIKMATWEAIASKDALSLNLIKLSFQEQQTNPHFRWEEEGREFVYYNQWYDVVKTIVKNDTTYFYCEHDVDEEVFINSFKNNQQQELASTKANLHKPLLIEGYLPENAYTCWYPFENQSNNFPLALSLYDQIFTDIPSPPPQLL